MPNIVEYNAPQNERLQPSDIGETSKVRAAVKISATADESGQRIKAGFAQAGQAINEYENRQAHLQKSQGLAAMYAAENNAHDQVLNMAKDPNFADDPDALTKMNKVYGDAGQKILDSTSNPQAREFLQDHFAERQMQNADRNRRDLDSVAAATTDAALTTTVHQASGLAEKDPSQMQSLLKTLPGQIDDLIKSHPNISPEAAAKMRGPMIDRAKAEIFDAGMGKLAMTAPGSVQRLLDNLPPEMQGIVPGTKYIQMAKAAISQQKQDALLGRQQAALNRADNQRAALDGVAGQLRDNLLKGQAPPASMTTDILDKIAKGQIDFHAGMSAVEVVHNRIMQPEAQVVSDPNVLHDLQSRISLPEGDPNRLTVDQLNKAELEHKITPDDNNRAYTLLKRADADPEVRNDLKDFSTISKSMNDIVNPKGLMGTQIPGQANLVSSYMLEKRDQFMRLRQAGVPREELLNDTGSKNYLFRDMASRLSMTAENANKLLMGAIAGGVNPTPRPFRPGDRDTVDDNYTPNGSRPPTVNTPGQGNDSMPAGLRALIPAMKGLRDLPGALGGQ